jgi:hypothetical protein
MKKLSVTYHAAKGDSKTVDAWGHTFFDGKPEQVTVEDALYEEMKVNRFFELSGVTDVSPQDAEAARNKSASPQPESGPHAKEAPKGR